MSKRHDAIFDDVLKDLSEPAALDKGGARFLKRQNALTDSGEREEKVLRWVDPASCVMWQRHNRAYDLLSEENCRDLIDSLRAQGQQEFPAIVRRLPAGQGSEYEVICGARRHFAVSWLRANNYPQFRYLIEVRDLTDEEAFRLADIENRDRADLSDYERARDYLQALELYYGGKQKAMATRLEVSEAWLSRYLYLARLPRQIVDAWPQITELKELHARSLRPMLQDAGDKLLAEAAAIADQQAAARAGQAAFIAVPAVLARLKAVAYGPKPAREDEVIETGGRQGRVTVARRGSKVRIEFRQDIPQDQLRTALEDYLRRHG
ncbi:ParB/RepB/Spo0J family partition protein [Paracoccus simplex]|uniref:ParB/RepB/Spo0J family partition protein n=1 Tax=Paracoccus simplex TaxID=2086346 RepID=A0ABV7S2U3_9RHOB